MCNNIISSRKKGTGSEDSSKRFKKFAMSE